MRLIVWIVDPDTATLRQLQDAWHAVAGTRVVLQLYTALPACRPPYPDLLMAEIQSCCAAVTQLLLSLRQKKSTDFLPVTTDTRPSSFTRAQQLGAIDYILKPFQSRRLRRSLRRYLALKQGLSAGEALTQGQLDLFFYTPTSSEAKPSATMPSLALSPSELLLCRQLLSFLLRCEQHQCTAAQAANILAVSRVTARKYLEILLSAGYVDKKTAATSVGRPCYWYQIKARLLPPQN